MRDERPATILLAAALAVAVPASAVAILQLDERSLSLLKNTLLLAGWTGCLCLPPGVLLGWLLARTDLPGRTAFLAAFSVLVFVPLYIHAAAWKAGFGLQGSITLAFSGRALLEGWTGAVWVQAAALLPWVVLIAGAGFRLVEPELEEQCLLDGSPLRAFLHVSLRGAAGSLVVAAVWVLIVSAGEMTVTDLFAIRTYAEEIYTAFPVSGMPEGILPGFLPGLVLVSWLIGAAVAAAARLTRGDRPATARRPVRFALRRWRVPALLAVGALAALLIGVPLASLCSKAGMLVVETDDVRARVWSLRKCLWIVAESPWRNRRELGWSLAIGASAASVSAAAGAALAWAARWGRLRFTLVLALVAVGLALPGPVIGLGVIHAMNDPGWNWLRYLFDETIFAPCLALVIRGIAPATLILWHALRSVPPELLDAAAVDGVGRWGRFWRIGLRSRLEAIALAWLVVLAISLGDLAATILVVPPGMMPLSVRIFDLLHSGVQDHVAGICLAMLLGFALIAAFCARAAKRPPIPANPRAGSRPSGEVG